MLLAQARRETALPCRVIMDLAGPKIRTGAIKCDRRIATWKPVRNDIGMPTGCSCHVPAIWATQVLDTLARTGVPSRAEVTYAAQSVGAECVMLNKGPYVDEAVSVLADILRRMEKHRDKKRSLFG